MKFDAQNAVHLRWIGARIRSVAVASVGRFFILLLRSVVHKLIWIGMSSDNWGFGWVLTINFIWINVHMNYYSCDWGGWNKLKKALTEICYRFFTNLSNPTRLAALEQLMDKPMSVNELADALGQEQSMISHNLKPLLECNLITIQKQGKKHVYSANQETLSPIFEAIQNHAQKFCPTGGKCLKGEN